MDGRRLSRLSAVAAILATWSAALPAAAAKLALSIELAAAWNGHVSPGHIGEAVIRIASAAPGEVRVAVRGARPAIEATVRVAPGVVATAVLPVTVKAGTPVTVLATRDDGATSIATAQLFVAQGREQPVAVVSDRDAPLPSYAAGPGRLVVGPGALPRTAAGYDAIAAVAMPGRTLPRLDAPQRAALRDALAACRRILVVGLPAAAAAALRARAGCDGAYVAMPATAEDAAAALARLLERPPPDVVAPRDSSGAPIPADAILALLAGYVVVVLGAAVATRRAWVFVAASVAASVAAAVLWVDRPPRIELAIDVLPSAGAAPALYRIRAFVDGIGRGPARLAIPAASFDDSLPERATLTRDASPWSTLVLPTGLGVSDVLAWQGAAMLPVGLRLVPDGEGFAVANAAATPAPAGWLVTGRSARRVPPIAAGARWHPPADGAAQPVPAEIAAHFSPANRPALVVPVTQATAEAFLRGGTVTGWLRLAPPLAAGMRP